MFLNFTKLIFQRRRNLRRRGMMLVMMVFLMAMFMAIASLAVDYGHVQLVKTQMQRTADAVARGYMEYYISDGQAYANSTGPALYASTHNPVDVNSGVSPTVTVTYGYWNAANSTFSTSTGTVLAVEVTVKRTAAAGNAVPLYWGGMIGIHSIDVHATAIACATSTSLPFVGLSSVAISNSATIDSYSTSTGIYSAGNASSNANVQSNGNITVGTSSTVKGNATPGIACTTTTSGGGSVTGSTTALTTTLSYSTPTLPASYTSLGTVNFSASGNMPVAGGNYYCTGLTISGSGTFSITGPVNMYVDGPVSLSGNVVVAQNLPENLHINVLNNSAVSLSGTSELDADIIAPLSTVTISGGGVVCGGVVAKSLVVNGGSIHNDLSGGGTYSVSMVQ